MVFDNSNIASGGSGGGGGGGQITVDTQVMQGSTNPVQNGAIYDFVNSSVSTNTAYFIGTFNSLSDLENYSGEVSNNDYAFVVSVDLNSNTVYNRYKYNSENETWNFEYSLNNSSFTAAEWETIQSGLTANDRTNYNNHLANTNNPHSVTKAQVGLGNVDNTSDANKPVSTAMQTALDAKQDTLTFDGTYNASTNKAATVSTVTNAINNLDVSSVGGSGKYISAISETDGKISPIVETMDTVPTNGSSKAVTSGGVQAPLAEVIDNGAKNLVDINSPTSLSRFTVSSGVLTSQTGDNKTNLTLLFKKLVGSSEITINSFGEISESGVYSHTFQKSTENDTRFIVMHSGSTQDYKAYYDISALPLGDYVAEIYVDNYLKSEGGYTLQNLMVCTKSQWDVSHQFEPYAKTNPELTAKLTEIFDDQQRQKIEIDYAVNTGVVNILANTAATTTAANGMTYTVNADKSVTVTGNASYYYAFTIAGSRTYANAMPLKRGTYIIKAGIAYDSSKPIYIQFGIMTSSEASISWQNIYAVNKELVVNNDTTRIVYELYNPSGNFSGYNATFYPMILDKSLYDAGFTEYQPYALPNTTLTPAAIKAVDEGAKNIADLTSSTKTIYTTATGDGVTITRSGDIFTISGTSGTNTNNFFNIYYGGTTTIRMIPPGNWVALIEDYTGSVVKDIAVQIAAPAVPPAKPYGTPVKFSLSGSETGNWLRVNVRPSTTYNGSFRLMICSQDDYAVSQKFVPYALSNPTLTPALIKQVDEGAKNLSSVSSGIISNSSGGFPIPSTPITIPIGTYIVSFKFSGNATRGGVQFRYDSTAIDTLSFNMTSLVSVQIEITSDTINNFNIYSNGTATISEFMICTLADWKVSPKFVPYAMSNAELTQQTTELTELTKGLVLIAHNSAQGNSGGLTYTPKATDFEIGNGANDRNSGSYLLYCVNWSTTGQPYIALITFSGGQIASLTKTIIVNGFEPTVDLTGGIITVSTCARASLYALR